MPGTLSAAMVSAGDRRASSDFNSPGPQATSSNRPVEMSAAAIAHSSPARATAASQLALPEFEQRLLGQRPGSDQPDDGALDQRLGPARLARLGGAFDLLGDGDAVPGADQPGEIGFGGMDRDAAHRHRLAAVRAALGQRDVERRRGRLGVVEEQLEEVAHPVEQQRVAGLRLEAMILRHHRRLCRSVAAGHRSPTLEANARARNGLGTRGMSVELLLTIIFVGFGLLLPWGLALVLAPAAVGRRTCLPGSIGWRPVAHSMLAYVLAFNLTFFIQELFLVLPKALVPGLQPTLYPQ